MFFIFFIFGVSVLHNYEGRSQRVTCGSPVADDEYAKVELKDGGEERKGDRPCSNGEEVPQHLCDHGLIGHGQLVLTGVP